MQEPKIVYKKIILNGKNVSSFLGLQNRGACDIINNCIILYRYVIGKGLSIKQEKHAQELINFIQHYEYLTIAHEMHHWKNYAQGGYPMDLANGNYYKEISLYYLDEMSAFSAGALRYQQNKQKHNTRADNIVQAIHSGIAEFIDETVYADYMRTLIKWIRYSILSDLRDGSVTITELINLQKNFHKNSQAMFDDDFHDAVKKYFTFDGYCVMNDKLSGKTLKLWREIENALEQIKFEYLTKTDEIITNIIKRHRAK